MTSPHTLYLDAAVQVRAAQDHGDRQRPARSLRRLERAEGRANRDPRRGWFHRPRRAGGTS